MQDVEDFDQTNENNNEEGRKKTSPCRHTTFGHKLCTWQLQKRIETQSSTFNSCIQACQVDITSSTCNFYKQTTSNVRPSDWAMHAPQ